MEKNNLTGSASVNNLNSFNCNSSNTTITSNSTQYGEKKIINVEIKDITIEISYRQPSNTTYLGMHGITNSYSTDRVWKEVYGLKEGKMTLLNIVKGKHIPEQYISECFEFED